MGGDSIEPDDIDSTGVQLRIDDLPVDELLRSDDSVLVTQVRRASEAAELNGGNYAAFGNTP
jgi:hypothetical protein